MSVKNGNQSGNGKTTNGSHFVPLGTRNSSFVISPSRRLWIELLHSALNEEGRAGFVMANGARNGHSCSMKITEDVREYPAELGIAEQEGLKRGMEAKSKGVRGEKRGG